MTNLSRCVVFFALCTLLNPTSAMAQTVITVNGVAAPTAATVAAGTTTTVSIASGPGSPADWVALYPVGVPDGAFLDWRYLNGATVAPDAGLEEATLNFTMPVTPGNYEFRFFANNGFGRLATSGAVTVIASPAQLSVNGTAPPTATSANAGAILTVEVSNGPGNIGDWVGFFAAGAPDGTYLSWKYLNGTTTQPVVGSTSRFELVPTK